MPNKELKKARLDKEVTQTEISKALKMNISTYNRKENGLRPFTEDEIIRVSEYLGVDPMDIFFKNKVTECIKKEEGDNE